jgi:hypothetical protein
MACKKLTLIAVCLLSAGCLPPPQYDSEYEAQFQDQRTSPVGTFASGYFPASYGEPRELCGADVPPWPLIGEVEEEWYAGQWMAAREPSLFLLSKQKPSPEFVLRFSYIPSFSPSIFVRIQRDDEGYILIAKRLSEAGGYEPGSIASSKKIRLSPSDVAELKKLLRDEALFQQHAHQCGSGFDGSEWLFEMVDPQGYRLVKRWSPTEGAGLKIGEHLLDLTGWSTDCYYPFSYPFGDVEIRCEQE